MAFSLMIMISCSYNIGGIIISLSIQTVLYLKTVDGTKQIEGLFSLTKPIVTKGKKPLEILL